MRPLVNELVITFCFPIKCVKAQSNLIILWKVIEYTTFYFRQKDTLVKPVFSDSRGLRT